MLVRTSEVKTVQMLSFLDKIDVLIWHFSKSVCFRNEENKNVLMSTESVFHFSAF
jgi:hypothetical protein